MGQRNEKGKACYLQIIFWVFKEREDLSLMDKFTEIKIEEIFEEENNLNFYWIYHFINAEVKIVGRSSIKPKCFRQIVRYVKWVIILKIN